MYGIGNGPKKMFSGTGIWEFDEFCPPCQIEKEKQAEVREAARVERSRALLIKNLTASSGFMPKELSMIGRPWEGNASIQADLMSWYKGEGRSLYLYGKPGNGKTHASVVALNEFIVRRQLPGKFFVVADLIRKLRMAVGTHKDDAMVEEIANAPALILDDIAVERPTGFVLEAMQCIIDTRYRNEDKLTIVTSNLSLNELQERLDDRIASRLTSMCEVIEFTGDDRRLGRTA